MASTLAASKETFECNHYSPHVNLTPHQPIPFLVLEGAFLLAGIFQIVIAFRTRRIGTFVGVLFVAFVMEFVGWYTQSHTHVPFFLQVNCFLSLKEALWYLHTIFDAVILVQHFAPYRFSLGESSLLIALVAIAQDTSYEMTNTRIQAVYLNERDFQFGDLSERVNEGSSLVIASFFLVALSVGVVSNAMRSPRYFSLGEAVFLPMGCFPVLLAVFTPLTMAKYAGCFHIWTGNNLWAFHTSCVMSNSVVKTSPLLLLGMTLSLVTVGTSQAKRVKKDGDAITFVCLGLSAVVCHATFLYHAVVANDNKLVEERITSVLILFSLAVLHLGLVWQLGKESLKSKVE